MRARGGAADDLLLSVVRLHRQCSCGVRMSTATPVWRPCRCKRRTCRHIQAWGKLRAVRQQHQQRAALLALSSWACAGQHYRRQLVVRCLRGWRAVAVQATQWLAAAARALSGLRQHQVVVAWWQYVQDQVGAHDVGA